MVDFKLWLWPEWYQECNKIKTSYSQHYPIAIYGSVFDRSFWEIALDTLVYLMDKPPTYKLQLIILPISRKTTVNQKIKAEIYQILVDEPISKDLLNKMNHLVVPYWEVIVDQTRKFQEGNLMLGLGRQSPEDQNHLQNRCNYSSGISGIIPAVSRGSATAIWNRPAPVQVCLILSLSTTTQLRQAHIPIMDMSVPTCLW